MPTLRINFNTDLELTEKLSNIRITNQHTYILGHPSDIYFRKLSDIEKSLVHLTKFVEKEDENIAFHPVKTYIQSLATFYDNIFRILKYSQDLNNISDAENAINWIRKNGTAKNKSFFKNTEIQQKLIMLIDNKFKHDDVKIVDIKMEKRFLNKVTRLPFTKIVKGFYIISIIDEREVWGSNPDIHPPIITKKGRLINVAISYNFFILSTVYSLIHWLETLSKIFPVSSNLVSNTKAIDSLNNILEIASSIDEEFFPDEYKKAYAQIIKKEDHYLINYPYSNKKLSKSKLFLNSNVTLVTDACNQALPYFFPTNEINDEDFIDFRR